MKYFLCICILLCISLSLVSCGQLARSFKRTAADIAYNTQRYDTAIKLYRGLLKDNPKDPLLNWNLGISYYSKGDMLNCSRQVVSLRKLGLKKMANDLDQLIQNPR